MNLLSTILIIILIALSFSCATFMNHQHDIIVEQRIKLRDMNCSQPTLLDILKETQ